MKRTVKSACPLDCPDACSLDVLIEGDRVVALDGNHDNPLTAGFICQKVHHFPEHAYGPERVTTPLRRAGAKGQGRFTSITWDDALTEIADRLGAVRDRLGGESILPYSYGGSNGFLTHQSVDARFFRRLGASRLARTVCAAPSSRAADGLYGKMPGVSLEDYPFARLIILWGVNPSASGIHHVPFIQRAREQGAELIVIDPRRTPLARSANIHLPIRPGTDLPVALALANWLFEQGRADLKFLEQHAAEVDEFKHRAAKWSIEVAAKVAGIDAGDLLDVGHRYATTRPAVIRCGWGAERSRHGGSAIAAILALPAIAGKFAERGGGYTMSNSGAWNVDLETVIQEPEPSTRVINMNQLGKALTSASPPIKALFIYNSNALASTPAQALVRKGLERDDLFTVVHDQVMTDTARYADIVLPATTFLEHDEFKRGYGAMVLQRSRPVIGPVGEARSNIALFAELIERLGLARPGDLVDPDAIVDRLIESTGVSARVRSSLDQGLPARLDPERPVQFTHAFPNTADRKVHLVPAALDREAPGGLYHFESPAEDSTYPLALISPASGKMITSTLGQNWRGPALLEISPSDAGARNIADGSTVRIFNEAGEVRALARVTANVRAGVVVLPKGLWARHTLNGSTANLFAPDTLTDLGGGACFNDARVEVEALRDN